MPWGHVNLSPAFEKLSGVQTRVQTFSTHGTARRGNRFNTTQASILDESFLYLARGDRAVKVKGKVQLGKCTSTLPCNNYYSCVLSGPLVAGNGFFDRSESSSLTGDEAGLAYIGRPTAQFSLLAVPHICRLFASGKKVNASPDFSLSCSIHMLHIPGKNACLVDGRCSSGSTVL